MALMVFDAGEVEMMKRALNFSAATNQVLKLFANDQTPAEGHTTVNYTEPTAGGYTAVALTGTAWTVTTQSNVTTARYANQSFTFSTAATVYGYYITNASGSIALLAERFASALITPANGGSIVVTPLITAD